MIKYFGNEQLHGSSIFKDDRKFNGLCNHGICKIKVQIVNQENFIIEYSKKIKEEKQIIQIAHDQVLRLSLIQPILQFLF
ncbi:hypothetical protein pb186bvf_005907 [Paramecium bursaria]